MKGFVAAVAVVAVALSAVFCGAPVNAQDDAEATIAALQTEVTEVEATIAAGEGSDAQDEPEPTSATEPESDTGDPIQISPELEIAYYNLYASGSEPKASGEIVNLTDGTVQVPNILFQFLDEGGVVLGEDEAEPMSFWVGPQQRMPFTAFNLLGGALLPKDWASVNVLAGEPGYYAAETYSGDLAIIDGPETGRAGEEATGRIQNNGQAPVGPVSIHPAYFNEDGVFLGYCLGDYLDLEIQPGRAARFAVTTGGGCGHVSNALAGMENAGEIVTYRLIVSVSPF